MVPGALIVIIIIIIITPVPVAARSNAESAKAFKDCGFESHLVHECLSVVR